MRLPRLTRIHTVDIYLKGGAVIRKDFTQLSWKAEAEGITNLKWTCGDGMNFVVVLDEIASINVVSSRVRIRVRDAA